MIGHLIPSPELRLPHELIHFSTEDGEKLAARYVAGKGDLVVYLFHGLGGSIASGYMRRAAALAAGLGASVYLVNHRGCGEGKGLAERPYHSGSAEDLSVAIAFGRKRDPGKLHVAVGFSLSANALLLLMSGARGSALPDAAIAVNAPIDLDRASASLHQGFNRIYDLKFVWDCRKGLRDPGAVPIFTTIREFDELYTARAGGFEGREDYYRQCSTKGLLERIQAPTLVLMSKDDPFIDYRDYLDTKLSPSVLLHLEERGGHLGYLSANPTPLGTRRWLDYALVHYLRELTICNDAKART